MTKSKKTKQNKGAFKQRPAELGHVRVKIRTVTAISNVPATVVTNVGDLKGDSTSLLWVSTFAAMADIFRYWRLNTLGLRAWPAVSTGYAARTTFPSSFFYCAPFGSADPTAAADVEAHPRIVGNMCHPFEFPVDSTCLDSVFVPKECAMSINLRNNDFTIMSETDRPGCLLTQQDGNQITYGRVYIVKRSAGSGTSTNWDMQMDMDVAFYDLLDPSSISRLMEHRSNPNVQIDPTYLQSAVSNYSAGAIVKSPSAFGATDSKDELVEKLKKLLSTL